MEPPCVSILGAAVSATQHSRFPVHVGSVSAKPPAIQRADQNRGFAQLSGHLFRVGACALAGLPLARLALRSRHKRRFNGQLAATEANATLPDGRRYTVFPSDVALAGHICAAVRKLMVSTLAEKRGFSMSIGSGTTVAPLKNLGGSEDIDFNRVHVFFGNERTMGDSAGKCFQGAKEFVEACGIPAANVHPFGQGEPEEVASKYEAHIFNMPSDVVGRCERNGLPALDLFLLGSGADGHTASLYPGSNQVVNPSGRLIVPAQGKGGVTATINYIGSARQVIISAGKAPQASMVKTALGRDDAAANSECPAGMISASAGTEVNWLLTESSAVELSQAARPA